MSARTAAASARSSAVRRAARSRSTWIRQSLWVWGKMRMCENRNNLPIAHAIVTEHVVKPISRPSSLGLARSHAISALWDCEDGFGSIKSKPHMAGLQTDGRRGYQWLPRPLLHTQLGNYEGNRKRYYCTRSIPRSLVSAHALHRLNWQRNRTHQS